MLLKYLTKKISRPERMSFWTHYFKDTHFLNKIYTSKNVISSWSIYELFWFKCMSKIVPLLVTGSVESRLDCWICCVATYCALHFRCSDFTKARNSVVKNPQQSATITPCVAYRKISFKLLTFFKVLFFICRYNNGIILETYFKSVLQVVNNTFRLIEIRSGINKC